jgi:hypothetical protein
MDEYFNVPYNDTSRILEYQEGDEEDEEDEMDTYNKTMEYVDHELNQYGLASPLRLLRGDRANLGRSAETMYELLRQKQRDQAYREEMEERFKRLQMENEGLLMQTVSLCKWT